MPTNNSERSCPRSHENSQTSPHNPCTKITSLAKNPSTHPLQNSISYLQHSSNLSTLLHSPTTLLHSPTCHHPTTRVYSLIIISFLVSPSSLILFEVLQPLLCLRCTSSLERTPLKDLRQFAHPPNRALNFTYPPLALSSATFHSRLKTELFKIFYPGSTSAPRHVRHHHLLQPYKIPGTKTILHTAIDRPIYIGL